MSQKNVRIFRDNQSAAKVVAGRIAQLVRERNGEKRPTVLGLATGNTPINVYRELIRMHREEDLDLSRVVTFNLDEYWPIRHESFQSYHRWMHSNFFRYVNIPEDNIHIPGGEVSPEEADAHCARYEQAIRDAGGIDIQLLGIGRSGHIGFNEPGSSRDSRTRVIELDSITRKDAASDFFGEENVPRKAITMGVASILDAREICLLAFGEGKAAIVRRAVEGPITSEVAGSYLREHPNATYCLDPAAAASLSWVDTPWLCDVQFEWDDYLKEHAVIWLARELNKPLLKLTEEDYLENGLSDIAHMFDDCYDASLAVFKRLIHDITAWPGGKTGKRRILVLSPHPDDDVICMGGTMTRMARRGHEIHTAYMVSGCLAVFDHVAARHAEFAREFNSIFGLTPEKSSEVENHIDRFLRQKAPGEMDSPEVMAIKTTIRKTEAMDAATFCGLRPENVHFLEMPFYNTGRVEKSPIGEEDIAIVQRLYEEVRPDMVFAAGDLTDPHGTHRQCLEAALTALDRYVQAGNERPEVWFYRGAWQEWAIEQIDMAVPLSPSEVLKKRDAIFRHESQKDRAMFPGPFDTREFWQRAEDRNRQTAELFDALGLPEYQAVEAFAKHPIREISGFSIEP